MSEQKRSTPSVKEVRKRIEELEVLWLWIIRARARFQGQLDSLSRGLENSAEESRQQSEGLGIGAGVDWLRPYYLQAIQAMSEKRDEFDLELSRYTKGRRNVPPFALREKYRDADTDDISTALNLPPDVPLALVGPSRDRVLADAYANVTRYLEDPTDAACLQTAARSLHVAQRLSRAKVGTTTEISARVRELAVAPHRPGARSEAAFWILESLTGEPTGTVKHAVTRHRKAQRSSRRDHQVAQSERARGDKA